MTGTAPSAYSTKTGTDWHTTSYPTTSAIASFHTCALKLCKENMQNETMPILIYDDQKDLGMSLTNEKK